ncbi:MAG: MoaD/ThiS family protein [Pyrinomonadaceae bacterium]
MPIQVLFFGSTAAITGQRQIEIDLANGSLAKDIFDQLLLSYPDLNAHRLLFSVNQQYATGDETVIDGDELAIFTAVSGG